jgi:hypothetical protein
MQRITYRDRVINGQDIGDLRALAVGRVVEVSRKGDQPIPPPYPEDGIYRVLALDAAPDQLLSGGLVPGYDVMVTLERIEGDEEYLLLNGDPKG